MLEAYSARYALAFDRAVLWLNSLNRSGSTAAVVEGGAGKISKGPGPDFLDPEVEAAASET